MDSNHRLWTFVFYVVNSMNMEIFLEIAL